MTQVLAISVRFHDGRYHGFGDWPPSPARLFQALVASAAYQGLDNERRQALGWLEILEPPIIAAPPVFKGQTVRLYVPNNDLDDKGGDIRRLREIRGAVKTIQPLLFDPDIPIHYIWRFSGDSTPARCICSISNGLYQLGRGVDMAWAVGEISDEPRIQDLLISYPGIIHQPSLGYSGNVLNCPSSGSLESLYRRHQANAKRFRHIKKGRSVRTEFTSLPRPNFQPVVYNSPSKYLLFELRRTTIPGAPSASLPLCRSSILTERIRGDESSNHSLGTGAYSRLAKHFDQTLIEKILIGRNATEHDKTQRIRIIPLPSIGHFHADRHIRRVLIQVPPDCPMRADDLAWGFAGLEVEAPVIDSETGEVLDSPVELVKADDDSMLKHYGLAGSPPTRLWRSVIPAALPLRVMNQVSTKALHKAPCLKSGSERLIHEQLASAAVLQALRHAGIRTPVDSVRVQREPFSAKGERAETFAKGTRFARDRLWHVELKFSAPIEGPLVIGDGRYLGLGVMAPVRTVEGILAYRIDDGLTATASADGLARALRRAMMARVQQHLGEKEALPPFFSGHQPDGTPLRNGQHQHLAVVADLPRKRLLLIAPHLLEGRNATQEERKHLALLDKAMWEMANLRAGRNGNLSLSHCPIEPDNDPLFGRFRQWETLTSYQPTRHLKQATPREALVADLLREIERRRLPKPVQIDVASVEVGPRGGLSGNIRLEFRNAEQGPLLLGRTRHFGGGLFAGI